MLELLDNVKSRLQFWAFSGGQWTLAGEEERATVRGLSMAALDSDKSDEYWLTTNSYLQPSALSLGDGAKLAAGVQAAQVRCCLATPPSPNPSWPAFSLGVKKP